MKKWAKVTLFGLLGVCGTAGVVAFRNASQVSSFGGDAGQLPPAFRKLTPGMSEAEVQSEVGAPKSRSTNSKYTHKSTADWAAIQAEVDADQNASSVSSATDPKAIRQELLLEHRIKDVWRYQPSSHQYIVARFDDQAQLVKLDTGVIAESPPNHH